MQWHQDQSDAAAKIRVGGGCGNLEVRGIIAKI